MNLLTFLEGRLSRSLRQRVETMEVLVKVVQRDAKASENRLRESIARARDELDQPHTGGAPTWRRGDDD